MLGVYTGSAVNALTQRAANDDIDGAADPRSVVSVAVTAGTTYRIAADSYNTGDGGGPDRGRIRFNWSFEPASGAQFTDVPTSSDFYDDIEWVASKAVTTGYGDCTYRPGDIVDRGAMAAFFYRLSGWPLGLLPRRRVLRREGQQRLLPRDQLDGRRGHHHRLPQRDLPARTRR